MKKNFKHWKNGRTYFKGDLCELLNIEVENDNLPLHTPHYNKIIHRNLNLNKSKVWVDNETETVTANVYLTPTQQATILDAYRAWLERKPKK